MSLYVLEAAFVKSFCVDCEFILLFLILLFFYSNVKGLPSSKAPRDAPEGLHCFQQRKVSIDNQAVKQMLAQ